MEIFMLIKMYARSSEKIFALTVWGNDCTWDKEARELIANDEYYENIYAEAVILDSLAHRLIINFTRQYYKPKRLMQIFDNENDAINWLLSLKNEQVSLKLVEKPTTYW